MDLWVLGEDVGANYWRMEECSSVFARRRSSQRQWRVAVKLSVLRLGADKEGGQHWLREETEHALMRCTLYRLLGGRAE